MIMKASQGYQRIPLVSVLAGKIKTLGFKVTHDWMQPIDDISQQSTVGITYLLAAWLIIFGWLTNHWLTESQIICRLTEKIYWTQYNCIKLFLKFLIQAKRTSNFHKIYYFLLVNNTKDSDGNDNFF